MRFLIALLSFFALALSPVAAPAASMAMAAHGSCAMVGTAEHGDHHSAPLPASVERCCVAVAVDLPVTDALAEATPVQPMVPVALIARVLGGAGPGFDDPPPKS